MSTPRRTRSLAFAAVTLAAAACGGGPPVCALKGATSPLPEGTEPPASPSPPRSPSRLGLELAIDRAALSGRLEAAVPPRLAEESRRPIGAAGRLTYRVDRGKLAVTEKDDALVVVAPIHAEIELCKPLGVLGCPRYASCSPDARATVTVPLALDAGYRMARPRFAVDLERPCRVTGLQIDVSPIVEQRAREQAALIEDRAAASLPRIEPIAQKAWAALHTTLPTPGGCLALRPKAITQGGVRNTKSHFVMDLAVEVEPEITAKCASGAPPPKLPPLLRDGKLAEGFDLEIAAPLAQRDIAREWARALDAPLESDAGPVRLRGVRVRPVRDALRVDAQLEGAVCGHAAFLVSVAPSVDGARVIAKAVAPASGVDRAIAAAIAPALTKRLSLEPPIAPATAQAALDKLDVPLDGGARLETRGVSAAIRAVYVVPEGLDVRVAAAGRARIALR